MHESAETLLSSNDEVAPRNSGAWSIVREAVRGSRRDFTQGPVGQAIFLLSVPMVLEMLMESVFVVCFLGLIGLIFVAFPGQIVGWFTDDPAVYNYAASCLRIIALGFLFYAYGMVLTQSFNGAGDTRTPTVINLFVYWLWEIPLGYVLAKQLGFGPQGVFWAVMVAFSSLAVVSAVVFKRGRWRRSVV